MNDTIRQISRRDLLKGDNAGDEKQPNVRRRLG